ncbi:DMT family transporter [Marinimicrobium sp. ARAG 43.8]|uniref:DMT family transporter n=1 Tax=Marinimicrobium sp. ARAG 43.8 TaxID=3418719 RepID=UPI003CEC1294
MTPASRFNHRYLVLAVATFCCFLWGSAYPIIKIGYEWLNLAADDTASQILFAGYRFLGSGALLLIFAGLMGKSLWRFSGREWASLAMLGLLQTTLQYVFFYIGLAHASGVKAAIMNATGTFFSVLLAHFIYRDDRLSQTRVLGCVIGFVGVVLVNIGKPGSGVDAQVSMLGEGFIAIAALVLSLSLIYGKHLSRTIDPTVMTAHQLTLGGVVLLLLGEGLGGSVAITTVASGALLLYLMALSAAAFALWSFLLKYNPVGQVIPFQFLIPIFGAGLSALLLQESIMEWKNLAALVLVCSGIWLVTRPSPSQRR